MASKDFIAKNGLTVLGDITVNGNVDGRDIAADGIKLDNFQNSIDAKLDLTGGAITGDLVLQGSDNYIGGVMDVGGDNTFVGNGASLIFSGVGETEYLRMNSGENTFVILGNIADNDSLLFNGNIVYHAGNIDSITGINADSLNGQDGQYYLNASNINSGIISDDHLPSLISSDITGNAQTATTAVYSITSGKWSSAKTITVDGDISGSVSIDGSVDKTLTLTISDNSHNHTISNISGLQEELDGKEPADNTILKSADLGSTVQPYDNTILKSADLGSTVQPYDSNTLKSNEAANLTKGFYATPYNNGTKTSGTFTPNMSLGNLQYAVNGGAHTLSAPTADGSIVIQYTNNASAGNITTSGFTKVDGEFTTTNGDDFMCYIVKINNFTHLNIVGLQ